MNSREDQIKRKKKHLLIVTILLMLLFLTGCQTTEANQQEDADKVDVTAVDETWTGEPTLSSAAQQLLQFTMPEIGDTVAEIIVEDYGSILIALFPDQAPLAVDNFLTHAREGYYDGQVFHRVIDDFMIHRITSYNVCYTKLLRG